MNSVQYIGLSGAEPYELRRHFEDINQDIHIKVASKAKLKAEVQHATFGMFNIWQGRFACAMDLTFPEPPNSVCLLIPLRGSISVNSALDEFLGTPGTLTIVNFSALRKISFSEDCDHIGLAFKNDAAVRKLSGIIGSPVIRDLTFSAQMTEAERSTIFDTIKLMWSQAKSSAEGHLGPLYFEKMFVSILMYILYNVPHGYQSLLKGNFSPAIPRQVKKACAFMHDNIEKSISVGDLAKHCSISVRSLQSAFRLFKNCTPMEFLTEVRLLRVRTILETAPDAAIAEIARDCGFNHPGRFSSIYKKAYGEFPNQTLDAAKRRYLCA